jgi:hypothetical protein
MPWLRGALVDLCRLGLLCLQLMHLGMAFEVGLNREPPAARRFLADERTLASV